MQHPLQPPRLACLSQSLQLIYSTWSGILSHVPAPDHFFLFYLLFLFSSKFIFTKPRVGMMDTFCSHHLPLRTLLPKLVLFLKTLLFPSLVLTTKPLLVLLKLLKIFLQRKQGTKMGFVFHLIYAKYWFLKYYFLSYFLFSKRLVYDTYTISCFSSCLFYIWENSTLLEEVSRTF
jgi:hypothetical protein